MAETDDGPGTSCEDTSPSGAEGLALRRTRLDIAFCGSGLSGWQAQKDDATVQDLLDRALRHIGHRGSRVVGCSRTDAGVHARAFTAHVDTNLDRSSEAILHGLNAHLPRSVRVYRVGRATEDFHARYSCLGKTYRYHIYREAVVPPFLAPYVLRWKGVLNYGIMDAASRAFVGEHNFACFTTAYGRTRNTRRTVTRCRIEERGPLLVLHVSGVSFLHRMVRLIGGALVAAGTGRLDADRIPSMLSGVPPDVQIPALPARGLVLWSLDYPPEAEPEAPFGTIPEESAFPV